MSLLKYYTDAHISRQVVAQLRYRQVDVIRCQEVDLTNASDSMHLEYAANHGYAVVTHDDDFLIIHSNWRRQSRTHGGVFFVQPHLQGNIGVLTTRLAEYAELIEIGAGTIHDDIANQIVYIG